MQKRKFRSFYLHTSSLDDKCPLCCREDPAEPVIKVINKTASEKETVVEYSYIFRHVLDLWFRSLWFNRHVIYIVHSVLLSHVVVYPSILMSQSLVLHVIVVDMVMRMKMMDRWSWCGWGPFHEDAIRLEIGGLHRSVSRLFSLIDSIFSCSWRDNPREMDCRSCYSCDRSQWDDWRHTDISYISPLQRVLLPRTTDGGRSGFSSSRLQGGMHSGGTL